jgi:hypothetical protein
VALLFASICPDGDVPSVDGVPTAIAGGPAVAGVPSDRGIASC